VGESDSWLNYDQNLSSYNTRKTFNKNISEIVRNMKSGQGRTVRISSLSPPPFSSNRNNGRLASIRPSISSSDSNSFLNDSEEKDLFGRASVGRRKRYHHHHHYNEKVGGYGAEKQKVFNRTKIALGEHKGYKDSVEHKYKGRYDKGKERSSVYKQKGDIDGTILSKPSKKKLNVVLGDNFPSARKIINLFLIGISSEVFEAISSSFSFLSSLIPSLQINKSVPFDAYSRLFYYPNFLTSLFGAYAILNSQNTNNNMIVPVDSSAMSSLSVTVIERLFPHLPILLHMRHPFQHLPHFYAAPHIKDINNNDDDQKQQQQVTDHHSKRDSPLEIALPSYLFRPLKVFVSNLNKLKRERKNALYESLTNYPSQINIGNNFEGIKYVSGKVFFFLLI
jgi:hypothetical protein